MDTSTDQPAVSPRRDLPPFLDVEAVRAAMPAEAAIVDVADVFGLLGDPGRLRILTGLLAGPMRVRDLASLAGLSESAVSHALRLLRAHRIVDVRRAGREAHYQLADSHVRALLELALDHVGHSLLIHHHPEPGGARRDCGSGHAE